MNNKIQIQKFDTTILPEELKISTMTLTGKFDTVFNLENIAKYLKLCKNGIVGVKHTVINRTIIKPKKNIKTKKNKISNKGQVSFFNQASVIVQVSEDKNINIKLFRNGAIQMTGCRQIKDCYKAINILCRELLKVRAVYNPKTKKITDMSFISNASKLTVDQIYNFNIVMINSNFNLNFLVDRNQLYQVLLDENANCFYDPVIHASVDIKYNYKGKKDISIFVFERGCVMITGANNCKQIRVAYNYIIDIIYNNYSKIKNVDNEIKEILNDFKKI